MSLRMLIQGNSINAVHQMLHRPCADIFNSEVSLTCSKRGVPESLSHLAHVPQLRHRELGAVCYLMSLH